MNPIEPLLQVGAQFTISASPFEVAHVTPNGLRVNPMQGGSTRFLTLPVIKQLLESNQIEVTYTPPIGANVSRAGLTQGQNEALNRKLRYVQAVFRGTEHVGSKNRVAPITKTVAAEIHDDSPPSVSTVAEWVRKWMASDFSEMALMPKLKPSRIQYDEDDDLIRIIVSAIREVYLNRQRNSIVAVQAEVAFRVAEYNSTAEVPLSVPCKETIRRIIQRIDAYQVDVARHGKAHANRRHRAPGRACITSEPLELVMADGQVMDVIVLETDEDGRPGREIGRPFITVILDVHTRCVLGAFVSLAPFCGGTLLKTMSLACVPHPCRPRGVPQKMIIDNGSDYQDSGFIGVTHRLGIILEPSPPYMPNAKAHVERFFRTLNEDLIHKLPGTTFSNPQQRGDYDSQDMARLTLNELRMHVDTWIEQIYHMRIHRGLGRAPIDVWDSGTAAKPIQTLSEQEADILIRTTVTRTVTNGCVQVHDLEWRSDALRSWELKERALRRSPVVEVQIDELDLDHVYVRPPMGDGDLIRAESRKPQYTRNLSLYEHRLLKAAIRRQATVERFVRMEDEELHRLRLEYYAALGHADDKVARARRDRLRDAVALREQATQKPRTTARKPRPTQRRTLTVNTDQKKLPHEPAQAVRMRTVAVNPTTRGKGGNTTPTEIREISTPNSPSSERIQIRRKIKRTPR